MPYDERKLCVICAWRGTCQLKYSIPGGVALHCVEYTRDVTLKEPEEALRKRNVLIIGPSGIGKTTLIRKVIERAGLRAEGYYTREVKDILFRSCLELVFLSSGTRTLADSRSRRGWTRAGRYSVNLDAVDGGLVPMLREAVRSEDTELIVLDEIGPQECRSELFRQQVVDCLTSRKSVLATLGVGERDDDFLLSLESRSDVSVVPLDYENRHQLVEQVVLMLTGERATA